MTGQGIPQAVVGRSGTLAELTVDGLAEQCICITARSPCDAARLPLSMGLQNSVF